VEETNKIKQRYGLPDLMSLFPPGIFGTGVSSPSIERAVRAFQSIEVLMIENAQVCRKLNRLANLEFPPDRKAADSFLDRLANTRDFVHYFVDGMIRTLMPGSSKNFINTLSDGEKEIMLKYYLHGHELRGKHYGVVLLIRSMAEHVCGHAVPVRSKRIDSNKINIPSHLRTSMGGEKSALGKDFLLGYEFSVRSNENEIFIGPIPYKSLVMLQAASWATEGRASTKLERLAEFAEPYYMKARIHILLETKGFKIGGSKIGTGRLGVVVVME